MAWANPGRGKMDPMPQLSEYLDYREFLKADFEERKRLHPLISYRAMSMRLELDAGQYYRIIHRDLHLPLRAVPRTCEVLGLKGRRAEHFELLVRYGRSRSESERQTLLARIMDFREVERRRLQGQEFRIFSQWFGPVVRSLACQPGTRDARDVADQLYPEVPLETVEETIALMEEHGFLLRQADGGWQASEAHLTIGGESSRVEAVRDYQRQVLGLAAQAIGKVPKARRDISTVTLAVDEETMGEVVEMLRECRRQIQRRVEECARPDRVLQMALAVFPVTRGGVE